MRYAPKAPPRRVPKPAVPKRYHFIFIFYDGFDGKMWLIDWFQALVVHDYGFQ